MRWRHCMQHNLGSMCMCALANVSEVFQLLSVHKGEWDVKPSSSWSEGFFRPLMPLSLPPLQLMNNQTAIFGVFDGHAGAECSQFVGFLPVQRPKPSRFDSLPIRPALTIPTACSSRKTWCLEWLRI